VDCTKRTARAIVYHCIFRIVQLELRYYLGHAQSVLLLINLLSICELILPGVPRPRLESLAGYISSPIYILTFETLADLAVENVSRTLYRSILPLRNEVSRRQYDLFTQRHIPSRHISESARAFLNLSPIESYLRYDLDTNTDTHANATVRSITSPHCFNFCLIFAATIPNWISNMRPLLQTD